MTVQRVRRTAFVNALSKIQRVSVKTVTVKSTKKKQPKLKQTKRVSNKKKTTTTISFAKRKRILSSILTNLRNINKMKAAEDLCLNTNVCLLIGMFSKRLNTFFKNFKTLKNIKHCNKLLLNNGKYGVLFIVKSEIFHYKAISLLKFMNVKRKSGYSDILLYEFIVGKRINLFTNAPNILTTLNLYRCNSLKDHSNIINSTSTINTQKLIKSIKVIENVDKDVINESCKSPELYALEQLFIPNAVQLSELIEYNEFMKFDLLPVLFQVYSFLRIYQNVFTHYDLHANNELLVEVPNRSFEFQYIDKSHTITFKSQYMVKIIDYARSYCQNITEKVYSTVCQQPNCGKDCGTNNGYYWLSNTNKNDHIKSRILNRTDDLHLLDDIRRHYCLNKNPQLKKILSTVYYPIQYASPEIIVSGLKKNRIQNVEDAYQVLLHHMINIKQNKQVHKCCGRFTISTDVIKNMNDVLDTKKREQSNYRFTLYNKIG